MIKGRCPTCKRLPKRSSEANRRLWAIYHEIAESVAAEGRKFNAEIWHEYFKEKFIGAEEIKLPNGQTRKIVHSTADLETPEFADYMTQVEAWAAERGVYVEFA